ncbi:peptide/nickel transport system substrate-binding protein [Leucobacter komagatae]|uniref:Peptide/nickel transport system substrate-binding protein n=1 Tax=Leucobacter komagatae TaxID=55969 RepID=A0A542XY14_9MICO|nr:ABC transporter substrate-binding protein [Leucobacter komagatae]TQL40724.1 peptide/nickel transport system substrate-binding protein [Leucobacter komagatae]
MEEELKKTLFTSVALAGAAALLLSSCASGGDNAGGNGGGSGGGSITVGTTDVVTALDPAGSYDNGSFAVMTNVYPFLLNHEIGSSDVAPDIAESAEFTSPTEYTVKLKAGLKFANGNDLTSSDVKHSFDRQVAIADPSGPSSLLANLDKVEAVDDTTVVFHLKDGNDQTFPQVLSTPVAPIVDEDVFPADKLATDEEIVKGKAFAGQYTLENFKKNDLASYKAYDGYQGQWGAAKTADVNVKYFANETNLSQAMETKAIDVAFRSLSATDTEKLGKTDGLKLVDGPGGAIRYIVFNFDTQPFGAKTPDADPAKALAVRQAAADLIDRQKIATQVYKDTFTPLYSPVAQGFTGATDAFQELYGDKQGGPDAAAAKARLEAAGITEPVTLQLQYNPDHYGDASAEEYALVKQQLEADGVFKVDLQSTEWGQYSEDFPKDAYPMYQLGWFPDFSDADNFLTPFFENGGFFNNHYNSATTNELIAKERVETDADARTKLIEDTQAEVAKDVPMIPLLQGTQVAVTTDAIDGVVLDGSFKFRLGTITKN